VCFVDHKHGDLDIAGELIQYLMFRQDANRDRDGQKELALEFELPLNGQVRGHDYQDARVARLVQYMLANQHPRLDRLS
jgi:hypothetical protein